MERTRSRPQSPHATAVPRPAERLSALSARKKFEHPHATSVQRSLHLQPSTHTPPSPRLAKAGRRYTLAAMVLVFSQWDVSDPSFGGGRRVDALLSMLGRQSVLLQPRHYHPAYSTVPYPVHLGTRKVGINWGIFNFLVPRNAAIARGVVRAHSPQLAVFTSIWNRYPMRRFPGVPSVLDTHDVNAVAIAERFGASHPFTRMVQAQERRAMEQVDHVFTCSERDREQLIERYTLPPEKITTAPNGVDCGKFSAPGPGVENDALWQEHLAGHTVLFFMGKLDYQPNAAALDFLGDRLMPELERRAPGRFKVLVTGGPVPQRAFPPGMVFAGRVEDTRLTAYMKAVDICLAPVFSGSGTRIKLLEYMAAGRPVVSTPKGAEGIAELPSEAVTICGPESFASSILALANQPEARLRAGEQAQSFAAARYDWSTVTAPCWRNVLERWIRFL